MITSANATDGLASQASVTDGGGNTGTAGHWIGETTNGQVITGGVVSITLTVWLHVAVLPESSVAVQVRTVV